MFDPALYPTRLNQTAGQDLLLTSAMNYYYGVAQDEAEVYYACMAANNGKDMTESQKEAFYTGKLREYRAAKKAEQNWKGKAGDETPTQKFFRVLLEGQPEMHISYGLNSQLAKLDGKLVERTWKVGGMYSPPIERIIYWLDKARGVA